jgi:hypothetical protein
MAELDKSKIINLAAGQEEPFKVCHRSIGQQIIVATAAGPPGLISQQTPTAIPLPLPLAAPCIGPRCRMWDGDQAECLEVVAAAQSMERNNLVEEMSITFKDLVEQFRSPKGERRPLSVEITKPVRFEKED